VRIIGLDAAADLANFGCVVCRHVGGVLELEDQSVLNDVGGEAALAWLCSDGSERTLIAIDAPLGWPAPLTDCLGRHQAGGPLTADANDLFRRETDKWVRRVTGKQSLDIGADKIARAAWQALNVLNRLRTASGQLIPLAWRPDFESRVAAIEVYPAATLVANGLNSTGYEDASRGIEARRALSEALAGRAPWLAELIHGKVDVFDAGLCAIAGADFMDGFACGPEDQTLAEREGWIWVRSPRPKPGPATGTNGD
jgi:hypothetical protein